MLRAVEHTGSFLLPSIPLPTLRVSIPGLCLSAHTKNTLPEASGGSGKHGQACVIGKIFPTSCSCKRKLIDGKFKNYFSNQLS